jgi:AcrR family transcriptional regulator
VVNRAGRERDPAIDQRVLAAAAHQLARYGYEAMSLAAVAEEARTTRQALYRRWHNKAELAAAVVAEMSDTGTGPLTATAREDAAAREDDPFGDLVGELTDFQRGVSHKGRLSLVGTMLQDTTDADVRAHYRAKVIAPRRARLRAILERAVAQGLLDADADLEVALTMCTGSWYGRALAGEPVPRNWPRRAAQLIWRSLGGQIPQGTTPPPER